MPRAIVYHREYGCETGCCGHVVEITGVDRKFEFIHPYFVSDLDEDLRSWAEGLVTEKFGKEHVKDLDWANCLILKD